jgi:peroxin-6
MKQLPPIEPEISHLSKCLSTIDFICRIRFPRYPSHYFPIYIILRTIQKFLLQLRQQRLNLKLYPIPNKLFNHLIQQEVIQTEHTLFVSPLIFQAFVKDDAEEVHFINMAAGGQKNLVGRNHVLSKLLTTTKSRMPSLFQILSVEVFPVAGVFVRENCFYNFLDKHKIDKNQKSVLVNLQPLPEQQQLPQIATKANIFLINTPYELSSDVVDEIFTKFFETPRLLYRNHTYRIDLDRDLLGYNFHSHYFHIFAHLKKLYFKCLNLESKDNNFELYAIAAKSFTNLHQTTSINYSLPVQRWHDDAFTTCYPLGLKSIFMDLKSSILPFMDLQSNSCQMFMDREIFPLFLLQGPRGSGKYEVVKALAACLGMQILDPDCTEIVSSIAAQTETKLTTVLAKVKICEPMIICFKNFEVSVLIEFTRVSFSANCIFHRYWAWTVKATMTFASSQPFKRKPASIFRKKTVPIRSSLWRCPTTRTQTPKSTAFSWKFLNFFHRRERNGLIR